MEVGLIVAAITCSAAAPASADQRRYAKGKFVKCETAKKKVQCKDADAKFAKCGTAGAMPVN